MLYINITYIYIYVMMYTYVNYICYSLMIIDYWWLYPMVINLW